MFSIIIPAHNEEKVILRCLTSILTNAHSNGLEVIVVCNGCTDKTEQIAKGFNHSSVTVISTEVASKANALNIGDNYAKHFPRFYIDADIIVTIDTIRIIADCLNSRVALAVSPQAFFDTSHANYLVKEFYKAWVLNPYFRLDTKIGGSGIFALSEKGRGYFDKFPDIMADDEYMNCLFKDSEKKRLMDVCTTVKTPATLLELIKVKARDQLAYYQLKQYLAQNTNIKESLIRHDRFFFSVMKKPDLWLGYILCAYVAVMKKIYAYYRLKILSDYSWTKDESSRI